MPNASEILEGLANIAESQRALAVLWHVYVGLFVAFALFGYRVHDRLVGALLIPPLASVSVLAWIHGNPFNGTAFAALSIILIALLWKSRTSAVERAHRAWLLLGFSLVAFGWTYPHYWSASRSSSAASIRGRGL
jgi:hypothetical protein